MTALLGRARGLNAFLRGASVDPLLRWKTALTNRGSASARFMVMGDSNGEGQGASAIGKRWQDLLLASLRSSYGLTGGLGYVEAVNNVSGDSPWANAYLTSSTGTIYNEANSGQHPGLGTHCIAIPNGVEGTWTFDCTDIDIWYEKRSDGGTFTYQIDSGTPVSVGTAVAGQTGYTGNNVVSITGLTSGSHTLKLKTTAGGYSWINGFSVWKGDKASGISKVDNTSSGAIATDFFGPWGSKHLDCIASLSPDLVIITGGDNDAGRGLGPADDVASYAAMIDTLRTLPKVPSIAFQIQYGGLNGFPRPWAEYQQAFRAMCAAKNVLPYDLGTGMPDFTSGGGTYYRSDAHANDAGHALIAQILDQLVNPNSSTSTRRTTAAGSLALAPTLVAAGGASALTTESFTGTDGASWPTTPNTWTFRGASGNPYPSAGTIVSNAGKLSTLSSTGYDGMRAALEGASKQTDLDVTVTVTLAAGTSQWAHLWMGDSTGSGTNGQWYAAAGGVAMEIGYDDNLSIYESTVDGGGATVAQMSYSAQPSTKHKMRLRKTGTTVQVKAWSFGSAEPASWMLTATVGKNYAGYPGVGVQNGSASAVGSATFDDFSVVSTSEAITDSSGNALTDEFGQTITT